MKSGDLVEIVDETNAHYHRRGYIQGVTRDGQIAVYLLGWTGLRESLVLSPHALELCAKYPYSWEVQMHSPTIQPIHRED